MATTNKRTASCVTDIPDQLLAEIFLRLRTPEDLARASAACHTFRRVSTDRSFLRRFRCLHAPPLLGFLHRDGFHPAMPSTPTARALAVAADFTFSFLPSHRRWTVQDVRDGRVLLARSIGKHGQPPVFRDLAVCDPLHRRYVLLPPLPHRLAALLGHPFPPVSEACCTRFLVPLGQEEAAAGETAFRVILMVHCKTSLAAFLFSSSTDQWLAAPSKDLSGLALDKHDLEEMSVAQHYIPKRHYAYGCFYWDWVQFGIKKLLLLDTTNMEFSTADLPPGEWSKQGIAIVEAGEGRLGMFGFHGETSSNLSYTVARNKGESPSQWQMEKTMSLDSGYKYYLVELSSDQLSEFKATAVPIAWALESTSDQLSEFEVPAVTRHDSLSLPHVAAGYSALRRPVFPPTSFPTPRQWRPARRKGRYARVTDIPDHLLAEIFLRLPDSADLARASAASVSFSRLGTERSLLRRFRRLHAPPLLGFLESDGFHPALPPHPSARPLPARSRSPSPSPPTFPSPSSHSTAAGRSGTATTAASSSVACPKRARNPQTPVFPELALCDPLHRRYVLLPALLDDLTHLVEHLLSKYSYSGWRDSIQSHPDGTLQN
ncbi:hypothetical protein D1007_60604 [Hordeum vulgare]|nr:hypothetical protein D1007_60604 [Hordeum vulgare]